MQPELSRMHGMHKVSKHLRPNLRHSVEPHCQTSISYPTDLLTCINYRCMATGYRLGLPASEASIADQPR